MELDGSALSVHTVMQTFREHDGHGRMVWPDQAPACVLRNLFSDFRAPFKILNCTEIETMSE